MRACICQKKVVPLRPILFCGIVRTYVRGHIMTVIFLLCSMALWAEDSIPSVVSSMRELMDTTRVRTDSVSDEGLAVKREKPKKSALAAPVHYQSADSMIMMANGTAYLHGKGELKYQNMELEAEYVRMNIDSSQIYARGVYDSLNYEWKGKPVFKDGKDSYNTNEITYNIKTQKG